MAAYSSPKPPRSPTHPAAAGPVSAAARVVVAMERFVERTALTAVLRECGFTATETSTLEGLLRGVRERAADCVIVDVALEGADGRRALDVCRELQGAAGIREAPAILCMGTDRTGHAAALEAGADAFLSLPADPALFAATLRAILRRRAVANPSHGREDWLAALSHKLRGPLNSISAWAQLLRSGRLGSDASGQALDAIVRGVQAETRILDDVLDLARIDSGVALLESRRIAIDAVLEAAIASADPSASSKGVEIRRPAASSASVLGDSERLRQVFGNLLANAIRFTPAGGYVAVEVDVDAREAEVEVRVQDSGQGVEPELLAQLFGDAPAGRGEPLAAGGGLGLAIVKSLVQRHGGAVHASSEGPGRGATFSVRLPSGAASPATPAVRAAALRP